MNYCRLIIFTFVFGLLLPLSFVFAGTVLSGYKYAWSSNVGYINFENVIVSDSALSGYAWSGNNGWIKFNPAKGGVLNDGQGNLSGYAWGESLGWINFDNVSINTSTGRFSGTATGTLVGTLNFDCHDYCDVRTDWRPISLQTCTSWTYSDWGSCSGSSQNRTILSSSPAGCTGGSPVLNQSCFVTTSGGGGGGGGSGLIATTTSAVVVNPVSTSTSTTEPNYVETHNNDLIIQVEQSGQYTKDTESGKVVVDIPAYAVQNKTTFIIIAEPFTLNNDDLVLEDTHLVNNVFYNVTAKDQNGNYIHSFSSPITITLPVPSNLIGAQNLGVYWLNETNWQWVLIPDAVFVNNKVTFQVNHLTKFAIFQTVEESIPSDDEKEIVKNNNPKPSLLLPIEKKPTSSLPIVSEENGEGNNSLFFLILIPILIAIAGFLYERRRNRKDRYRSF